MKRRITLFLMTLTLLLSNWPSFTSHTANGKTGAGQQVGEPFRIAAIAAGNAGAAVRRTAVTPTCPSGNIMYVNASVVGGTGDGSLWANAYPTLTAALAATYSCPGVTQIWVAQGTYKPSGMNGDITAYFALKSGLAIYGGFNGTETQLNQRNANPATNHTVMSGDLNDNDSIGEHWSETKFDNSITIVMGVGTNNTAILDGFTISSSYLGATEPEDILRTSAMSNLNSSPTLTNLIFSGNVGLAGGGMTNYDSSPTLTNITFSGNFGFYGTAIFNDNSSPTLLNVTFSNNSSIFDQISAAMYNQYSGNPTLTNVTFSGNQGNGMVNLSASATLTNVTFSGNQGIGIYNENSILKLRNSILWGDSGGEILNAINSTATVSYSIVQGGYTGTGNLNVDPQFISASNLRLQRTSPAINVGDNNVSNPSLPATDLDGNPRVAGGKVDMGAFEYANTAPTINAIAVTRTVGSPATNAPIAIVSDTEDAEEILSVTATPISGFGVTLSGLRVDASGNVTANVATTCNATTSTFTLQVTDSDSSSNQTTLTVIIGPPDTNLVSKPPTTSGNDVTFTFTSTDSCSNPPKFECQLDNSGWSDCTSPKPYSNLPGGSHTFAVRAKDALGNVDASPATHTWTVFTNTCGTVMNPATLPAATRDRPFAQTLSASPTGSYTFSLLAGTLPPGLSLVNVLGIYSLRGTPTTAGTYQFTIKAAKNNSTCAGVRTYIVVIP